MDPVGEELERLARLRASGHLSNDEFEALKARLLSGPIEEAIVESESLDDEPLSEAAEPGVEDAGGVEPPVLDDSPPSAMDEEHVDEPDTDGPDADDASQPSGPMGT